MEKGREEGRREGREEGREAEKLEIARNMKALNLPQETILKATGLSAEELEKL